LHSCPAAEVASVRKRNVVSVHLIEENGVCV